MCIIIVYMFVVNARNGYDFKMLCNYRVFLMTHRLFFPLYCSVSYDEMDFFG